MCMSRPKIVQADPPPTPPPPPTEVAVEKKRRKKKEARKRGAGISSLIIRRPSVNTATRGKTGANMNY